MKQKLYEKKISILLNKEQLESLEKIIKNNPDFYESQSQAIRAAINFFKTKFEKEKIIIIKQKSCNKKISVLLHEEQLEFLEKITKKYSGLYENQSQAIRAAINFFKIRFEEVSFKPKKIDYDEKTPKITL